MRAIGLDVGGTNIKAGVIDKDGKIIKRILTPTCSHRGPLEVVQRICDVVNQFDTKNVIGAGIGIAGILNHSRNQIHCSPHLKGIEKINLYKEIKKRVRARFCLENDANMAAYGEKWLGGGRGVKNFVLLTLGTGIGGGVVVNGELVVGERNSGAELGHVKVSYEGERCECGGRGCAEAYASATAIVKRYNRIFNREITAQQIFDRAKTWDRVCWKIVNEAIEYLAILIANLVHIFSPQKVLLSGGIANAGRILYEPLKKRVKKHLIKGFDIKIERAKLGEDAGFIGAGGWAFKNFG
jgi:glucokinase